MSIKILMNLKYKIFLSIIGMYLTAIVIFQGVYALEAPKILAPAAIVMESSSGRILYQKNCNQQRPMASTTKIMTIILALEKGNLSDTVTVSKKAAGTGGSDMGILEGEKIKLQDMLYGLMLPSGNDAAVAIAEHIGGSIENFAIMMNAKAKEIGCMNSHFVTPHGLDNDGHYSTAYDLAVMTQYAFQYKEFNQIIDTQVKEVKTDKRVIRLKNTNPLLTSYNGADGVKTGYTGLADRCIVGSATRKNMRMISVVLGAASSEQRKKEVSDILDYAFDNYNMVNLSEYTDCSITTNIYKGKVSEYMANNFEVLQLPITEEEKNKVRVEKYTIDNLEAPVKRGTSIGNICVYIGSDLVYKKDVVVNIDIIKKSLYDYLKLFSYNMVNIKFT